jgi:DNA-binding winged helix-turn-helix (wHTH) protein
MLICTVDQSFSELLNFYVLPAPEKSMKWKILREGQPWLSAGRKLGRLEDFCAVANEVAAPSKNCGGWTAVDDILIAGDTWTMTLGQKEISLGPVGSAIFNMLAQNAGQVVSRDRLRRATPDLIDPSNLDAHIWTLRSRLGTENRKRIQTIKGVGYMYLSPGKRTDGEVSNGDTVWQE